MSKQISSISQISIISILMATMSCADYDTTEMIAIGEAMELRAEINQQYVTRASDGGFADGDQIGVFIVNYTSSAGGYLQSPTLQPSGNHADNVRFTYDEATGKWTGSYQLYWKDKKTPVDAYGYYPFDANLASTVAYPFSVQQNQRDQMMTGRKLSGYEQSDFLWAKKEGVVPTAGAVTLLHHHLMAGVKVTLTEGTGFEDGEWGDIQKNVLIENTVLQSTINIQTGTVGVFSGSAAETIIPQQNGDTYRAVVTPQTVSADKSLLAITIDNKTYHPTRNEEMVYYPGKLHLFTFNVNKSLETGDYELTLISESVTPWENDPQSHDGSAREYITVNIEEGEKLGDIISRMGLDPKEIINLKLTGTINESKDKGSSFGFLQREMQQIEALNLKELRTKNVSLYNDSPHTITYGLPSVADDWVPYLSLPYLQHIVWPDSVKGIRGLGSRCLRGPLVFPEGLRFIQGTFNSQYTTPGLISGELHIPTTVEYIGNEAFANTSISGDLKLPERMKYLGKGAFKNCKFLTGYLHIPDGLTEVNDAWAGTLVEGVAVIPQGVKTINGVGGVVRGLVIPEGVEEIAGCGSRSLTHDIHLPSTLKRIHENAFANGNFAHINLPEGIENIETGTFMYCNLQDTITMPSSVLQIQRNAFYGCTKLNAVILSENLAYIQDYAFGECYSLYYIRCLNPTPPNLASSAFSGVNKSECALVVPEGCVDAYRNAAGWREFKRISTYQNFVCRPTLAKLLNKGNTRTIVLNSDGYWEITSYPDWIHPSKTSGYKKTEMTVTIDDLVHGSANREGSIVFTLTDKTDENGNAITCDYKVQQFDYEYDEDTQAPLQQASKGNQGGINIVFVGDGYDAEDIASGRYLEDMKEGTEYFFAIEPYKTYRDYFNVYADMAMSYESGVQSSVDVWRQTKFGTTYGAGEHGRLGINDADVFNYVLNEVTASAITTQNVDHSLIVCVPNDDAHEGITTMYTSGAAIAFVPHSHYDYPNDYRGLMQHEAGGHGFGKLADEYIYHQDNIWNCKCSCCSHANAVTTAKARGWYRNLSLEGRYKQTDWSHLIFDPRYGDIVDIYEGGHMHGQGIYRSEVNSCMNNNVPYYSTISRQAIVERIKQYAGEPFVFEDFVSNDSREMGDKFLTRSASNSSATTAIHNPMPIIKKGSPLDYLKKKGDKK